MARLSALSRRHYPGWETKHTTPQQASPWPHLRSTIGFVIFRPVPHHRKDPIIHKLRLANKFPLPRLGNQACDTRRQPNRGPHSDEVRQVRHFFLFCLPSRNHCTAKAQPPGSVSCRYSHGSHLCHGCTTLDRKPGTVARLSSLSRLHHPLSHVDTSTALISVTVALPWIGNQAYDT